MLASTSTAPDRPRPLRASGGQRGQHKDGQRACGAGLGSWSRPSTSLHPWTMAAGRSCAMGIPGFPQGARQGPSTAQLRSVPKCYPHKVTRGSGQYLIPTSLQWSCRTAISALCGPCTPRAQTGCSSLKCFAFSFCMWCREHFPFIPKARPMLLQQGLLSHQRREDPDLGAEASVCQPHYEPTTTWTCQRASSGSWGSAASSLLLCWQQHSHNIISNPLSGIPLPKVTFCIVLLSPSP